MSIQIDHVVIAGKDLAQMRAAFAAAGLAPDEGGTHAGGETHNALIGFADGSYLELIAPTPGNTAPGHTWSQFMNSDAGVCAWAIRSQDIRADVEAFRKRGIRVTDPKPGGRTRPDGVRLDWITAQLGEGPQGSFLPFLIQDVTPRELRVPRTKSAEGIKGVAGLEIRALDLELFQKAFDLKFFSDAREHTMRRIQITDFPAYFILPPLNLPQTINGKEAFPERIQTALLRVDNIEEVRHRYPNSGLDQSFFDVNRTILELDLRRISLYLIDTDL